MANVDSQIQIASAEFKRDPHSFYVWARAESPVLRIALPNGSPAYLLSRYDDVSALLKDSRFVKEAANALTASQMKKQPWVPPVFAPLLRNMLDRDDPDHARLRRLVQKVFTPARVETLRERTQVRCDLLLDALESRAEFDLISEFALPLPVAVISDLLGVPEPDRVRFARWSNTLISNTMTPFSMLRALPHMLAFVRYLRHLIVLKRRHPLDDLVSALAVRDAVGSEGDSTLSDDELLGMIAILLTAGHETTTNLIGNGMLALIEHPKQLEQLCAQPALIDTAVEELLRFAGPVATSTNRYAKEDLELHGVSIPRGSIVLGAVESANRDERQFDAAAALHLARDPNRHLTFGQGGHYCVGAPLARMEGRIAIATLLRRMPGIRLATNAASLAWRRGLVLRGLKAMRVTRQR